VHNSLGRFRNEKQYADALESLFKENKINYEREKELEPSFEGEHRRRNVADFIVEDKIVLELKTKTALTQEEYFQVKRYLSTCNKKLGILVNFRTKYLAPKRILN
jgi:GxxExxY protein